jgi:hypothetical protein
MRLYYNKQNSKVWKSEKQLEFINRLIQFNHLSYYGEYGKYSLPLSFQDKLPYIESNQVGEGVTIRRLTNLSDEQKEIFQKNTDKIYNMVMGIEKENWDEVIHSIIKLGDDGRTLILCKIDWNENQLTEQTRERL